MAFPPSAPGDSNGDPADDGERRGGSIPGAPGKAAFTVTGPRVPALPVVIAVPHAGRDYPAAITQAMRDPRNAAMRLEDRLVDLVGQRAAEETGIALLRAHAPRAVIDLNRSVEEMDWTMVRRARELGRGDGALARRARSGLGLIPRRLAGTGEIWRAPLDHADVDARIAQVHRPYHSALSALLDDLRSQWGACLLIDLHSMPPLAPAGAGRGAADYVVGDRFGGSCAAALVADAFDIFARRGAKAAHNRPYAGGYVLDRHAQRLDGVHAIQLEISRATYLDADLWQPGTGLERVADLLAELVRALGERVSRMGGDDLTRAIAAE